MAVPAPQAVPAGRQSASYLTEVCELLWPAPASVTLARAWSRGGQAATAAATATATAARRELVVLPGARQPRLIVPAGRRASAAAIRRYGEPGSVKARLATRTLAVMLAGGLGPVIGSRLTVSVPDGAQTIDSYLASLLGRPVEISMHLGAARANRKPVLQLLSAAGDTIGFAKIGVNALTTELVRAEQAALARLSAASLGAAGLTGMRLPDVLAAGSWRGLEVLVLSPLPVWLRRIPLTGDRLARALAELSRVTGTVAAQLAASSYWQSLLGRLEQAGPGADQATLRVLTGRLAAQAGTVSLTFGCWHGDLTPWNLASTPEGLLVWDWERFALDTPIGFDALHYWLQSQVVNPQHDPLAAATGCISGAPALLKPFGVEPAAARLTALAYLADLSVRYLADRQAEAGARLGSPGRWLLPALESGIAELAEHAGPPRVGQP